MEGGNIWTQHAYEPAKLLLFDRIDGFEFFFNFLVLILSCLPLFQAGTAAKFPTLDSSQNCPSPRILFDDIPFKGEKL